jgi:hypothetical protein
MITYNYKNEEWEDRYVEFYDNTPKEDIEFTLKTLEKQGATEINLKLTK